ncbi:MAG: DUF1207 domain-containing protein [Ignavibacteriales bacterium]|nr:DUF1207 domain-containing protein [Ignavibacteriales bacterium]
MHKRLIFTVIAIGFIDLRELLSQPDSPLQFFPSYQMLRPFIGDVMAHRFGAAKLFGNKQFRGTVGSVVPVLGTDYPGFMLQASVGASVHAQLDLEQSISLMSTEFVIDFFLLDALVHESTIIRLGVSHTSHHLGDNALARLNAKPLDYSRDYLQLFFVHMFSPVRLYTGTQYSYNFVAGSPIHKPWWIQTGVDAELFSFGPGFVVYAGSDFKFRQEVSFASTQRFELGFLWPSTNGRNLRFSLAHQTGVDERGQFYAEHIQWNSIGVAIGL